jgi:hypothetical protein
MTKKCEIVTYDTNSDSSTLYKKKENVESTTLPLNMLNKEVCKTEYH